MVFIALHDAHVDAYYRDLDEQAARLYVLQADMDMQLWLLYAPSPSRYMH